MNNSDKSLNTNRQFRVMQWNGLAKSLCVKEKAKSGRKQPDAVYDWDNFRMWRLLEEIVRYNSDIICLQEADFYEDIKHYLHYLGYTSVFCPRYSSHKVNNSEDSDGCTIFYHTDVFQITQLRCQNICLNGEHNSQVCLISQIYANMIFHSINFNLCLRYSF
jgi:mRNA deadenylase 3'-5' endonuclease subunit Ccr4